MQVSLIVFFAYFFQNTLWTLDLMGSNIWNITVGASMYFPLGSFILVTLLYREKAIIGLFSICFLAGLYYKLEEHLLYIFTLINVFGPYLSIRFLEGFRMGFFKKFPNEYHLGELVMLCLTASIFNTLGKFFVYYYDPEKSHQVGRIWEDQGSINFLTSYLPGDLTGSIIFIFIALGVAKALNLRQLYIEN